MVIEAAMAAADRADALRQLWSDELAREEPRPSTLAKLAAEARLSERAANARRGSHTGRYRPARSSGRKKHQALVGSTLRACR